MLKFVFFVAKTVLKGLGFMINEIIVRISETIIPPVQYAQGYGGPDYDKSRSVNNGLINKSLPKVSLTQTATTDTPVNVAQANERDPLVLRTPQELMPELGQLKEREAPQVSSRVLTIPLEADGGLPIGTAWLYLFDRDDSGKPLNKARRVLKISNRPLARIICGPGESRYFFKDVEYLQEKGTREITDQFIKEIRSLLDKKQTIAKVDKSRAQTVHAVPTPKVQEAAIMPRPVPVFKPVDAEPARGVSRNVNGQVYEGVVVSVGMTTKGTESNPYQTFCLTINDGKKETPLNGTEIQRQVNDLSIKIGERIKVVSMGRSEVNIPNQKEPGWKNLYQITRLGAH